MDTTLIVTLILGLMFLLLAAGMPIGFAMGVAGVAGTTLFINTDAALALLGQTAFETAITYDLSVVPLFVLMGSFATSSGLSGNLIVLATPGWAINGAGWRWLPSAVAEHLRPFVVPVSRLLRP